jgi:hypothetical protein
MKVQTDKKQILFKIFDGILCDCDKIEHKCQRSSDTIYNIIKYNDKITLSYNNSEYSLYTEFNYIDLTKEEYDNLFKKLHQQQIIIANKELEKLKKIYVD